MQLNGQLFGPKSGNVKQIFFLFHGYGADGANLIGLADLYTDILPDCLFIAPNAPYPCAGAPYGYQWFDLTDRSPDKILTGMRNAADIATKFIDQQCAEHKVDKSNVILSGFSQGCMLALHIGLRMQPKVKAIIGFSGALVAPELLDGELKSKPPVCLIHGNADEVVPHQSLREAEAELKKHDVIIQATTRPNLTHSIDGPGVNVSKQFLQDL